MKKALGVLFTRSYRSHEAGGTFGARAVFSLEQVQCLQLPSRRVAYGQGPVCCCPGSSRHCRWKLLSGFNAQARLGHGRGWYLEISLVRLSGGVLFGRHVFLPRVSWNNISVRVSVT